MGAVLAHGALLASDESVEVVYLSFADLEMEVLVGIFPVEAAGQSRSQG
jgi:hypothetical protein